MIGSTIGKYRIVGQLGRGGAGVVYQAVDETLNRDVAIKMLNPELANTEVMSRFRVEATILARLNHPHIATIYELFHAEGDLLMVMELVRGESLDKLLERVGPLSPERAAYVIDLILSALEHAHRAGIVHRDVKPANVMVTVEGGVKIMDFGIARVLGAEQKTVDFRLMGTPAYMSPEQVVGEEVDGRSDLYSVGVLFYRLLTGALPFAAETALAMLQRQIRDEPSPLRAHRGEIPDWCEQVVRRALAKSPGERFQSAEEFREALSRATGPLPTADLARTFLVATESLTTAPAIGQTIALPSQHAQMDRPAPAGAVHPVVGARPRFGWVHAAILVLVAIAAVASGYSLPRIDSAEALAPVAPPEPPPHIAPHEASSPVTPVASAAAEPPSPAVAVPAQAPAPSQEDSPRRAIAEAVDSAPAAAVIASRRGNVDRPAIDAVPEARPNQRLERLEPAERRTEPRATAGAAEPTLVFETRALVGTRKPKEQSAQLVLGDGRITVIPQSNPTSPLCSFPYDRVISISVSRSRDPLWNSPEGPAPVARAGGTLSRLGIQISRDWIALHSSTEEQFVAMRFDEVLLKRVLLALEERTGRMPESVVVPRDDDDK
jgi:serine/threonine-protein kinase